MFPSIVDDQKFQTFYCYYKRRSLIVPQKSSMNRFLESLDSIPRTDFFPGLRHRWNTNEEIASILIALDDHGEWLSKEVKVR